VWRLTVMERRSGCCLYDTVWSWAGEVTADRTNGACNMLLNLLHFSSDLRDSGGMKHVILRQRVSKSELELLAEQATEEHAMACSGSRASVVLDGLGTNSGSASLNTGHHHQHQHHQHHHHHRHHAQAHIQQHAHSSTVSSSRARRRTRLPSVSGASGATPHGSGMRTPLERLRASDRAHRRVRLVSMEGPARVLAALYHSPSRDPRQVGQFLTEVVAGFSSRYGEQLLAMQQKEFAQVCDEKVDTSALELEIRARFDEFDEFVQNARVKHFLVAASPPPQ
jgi:hypothetical protein